METNKEKAKEIYEDNLYDCEVRSVAQDEQEILFMLEKMAKWKDEQFAAALDTINHIAFQNHEAYVEYIKTFLDL